MCLVPFQLKAAVCSRNLQTADWRFHPLKREGGSGIRSQFVLETVSAELVTRSTGRQCLSHP